MTQKEAGVKSMCMGVVTIIAYGILAGKVGSECKVI